MGLPILFQIFYDRLFKEPYRHLENSLTNNLYPLNLLQNYQASATNMTIQIVVVGMDLQQQTNETGCPRGRTYDPRRNIGREQNGANTIQMEGHI